MCSADQLRRDALAAYLGTLPDFMLVGQATGGADLVRLAEAQRPDVVLVDGGSRPGERVPALRAFRGRLPGIAVVLAYERLSAAEFAALRDADLAALVPYAHGLGGLLAVLRALPAGGWLTANGAALTARQRDILLLLRSGHHAGEIASLLAISAGTVENHKRRVYAKLGTPPAQRPAPPPAGPGEDPPPPPVGRPVLAVAVGDPGPVLDRVVTTLIVHRLAVVREHGPEAVAQVHWLRSHRGPVVRVLVNPSADQWQAGAALGWTAVMVHDHPIDRRGMAEAVAHGIFGLVPSSEVEQQLVPVLNLVAAGYLVLGPTSTGLFTDALSARPVEAPEAAPSEAAPRRPAPRERGPRFWTRSVLFT
ncbi:response regulator transcription factor [Phytohabitans suffuscus]|uniref:response regulator transcription factor n=1 Tax=Phytohabitans suffuscus TaxID=624315 RepID=UPI001567A041|nr:LuxR C-terminal-related transcriptional regulator [Phytohabitans suffuscus]